MSHLDHPHIIKYFDSFVDNGSLMIIMEFATKGTLHEFLQVQKDLLSQQVISCKSLFCNFIQELEDTLARFLC